MKYIPNPTTGDVESLLDRYQVDRKGSNKIFIPDLQRKVNQWSSVNKRNFINYILYGKFGISRPIILCRVDSYQGLALVDGLQRISTLRDFLDGKFFIKTPNGIKSFFKDLSIAEQDMILQYKFQIQEYNNVPSMDEAQELFENANEGISVNEFQKFKGKSKNVTTLCKLIDSDENIKKLLIHLGLATNKNFDSLNKDHSLDKHLVSIISMLHEPNKFKPTKSFGDQWTLNKMKLDDCVQKYLNPLYWEKISKQICSQFPDLHLEFNRKESRIMLLMILMYFGSKDIVRITNDLQEIIQSKRLNYEELLGKNGRKNSAGSRERLYNITQLIIKELTENRYFKLKDKELKLKQQNGLCSICNNPIGDICLAHGDHIKPYVNGGKTTYENLQVLCSTCNLTKGKK